MILFATRGCSGSRRPPWSSLMTTRATPGSARCRLPAEQTASMFVSQPALGCGPFRLRHHIRDSSDLRSPTCRRQFPCALHARRLPRRRLLRHVPRRPRDAARLVAGAQPLQCGYPGGSPPIVGDYLQDPGHAGQTLRPGPRQVLCDRGSPRRAGCGSAGSAWVACSAGGTRRRCRRASKTTIQSAVSWRSSSVNSSNLDSFACVVCGGASLITRRGADFDDPFAQRVNCERCGHYIVEQPAAAQRAITASGAWLEISAFIRRATDAREPKPRISYNRAGESDQILSDGYGSFSCPTLSPHGS